MRGTNPFLNSNKYNSQPKLQSLLPPSTPLKTFTSNPEPAYSLPSPLQNVYSRHDPILPRSPGNSLPSIYNQQISLNSIGSYAQSRDSVLPDNYPRSPNGAQPIIKAVSAHTNLQDRITPPSTLADLDLCDISEKVSYTPHRHTPNNGNTRITFPTSMSPTTYQAASVRPEIPYLGLRTSLPIQTISKFENAFSPIQDSPIRDETTIPASNFRLGNCSDPIRASLHMGGGSMEEIPLMKDGRSTGTGKRDDRKKEAFKNLKILECLMQYLDCSDLIRLRTLYFEFRNENKYKKLFQRQLEKVVTKEMNNEQQYNFWNTIIDFKKLRHEHQLAFTQQFVRECEHIRDITYDLDRTFPEYDKYSTTKGKDSLLKVLVAVANTVKEVGYIQGLNSIAGVFLFYLKEEESFWAMLYLLEKVGMKEIFKSDFEKVSILNYQLEVFVANYLPAITRHFEVEAVSLSYISMQWFMTLYSYYLDIPVIVKLWNLILIRGFPVLIQFGLAILSKYQDDLIMMNVDEIGPYLQEQLRQIGKKEESLFARALNFKVTNKLMRELEYYYTRGKPIVKLCQDYNGKLRWEMLSARHRIYQEEPQQMRIIKADEVREQRMKTPEPQKDLPLHASHNTLTTPRQTNTREKSPIFQKVSSPGNPLLISMQDSIQNTLWKKKTNGLDSISQTDYSLRVETEAIHKAPLEDHYPKFLMQMSASAVNLGDRRTSSHSILDKYEDKRLQRESNLEAKKVDDKKYEQMLRSIVFQKPITTNKVVDKDQGGQNSSRTTNKHDTSIASTDHTVINPSLTSINGKFAMTFPNIESRKQSAGAISSNIINQEDLKLSLGGRGRPPDDARKCLIRTIISPVGERTEPQAYESYVASSLLQKNGQAVGDQTDLNHARIKAWFEGQGANKGRIQYG